MAINLDANQYVRAVHDRSPFGRENRGEVVHVDDRPYGLVQTGVVRDDAPDAGPAWSTSTGLV